MSHCSIYLTISSSVDECFFLPPHFMYKINCLNTYISPKSVMGYGHFRPLRPSLLKPPGPLAGLQSQGRC